MVSTMRLENEAELIGDSVFSWDWPGDWTSRAEMTKASIIRKTDNDAVIKVSGKQQLSMHDPSSAPNSNAKSETLDCSAILTLYRDHGKWALGRVEFDEKAQ